MWVGSGVVLLLVCIGIPVQVAVGAVIAGVIVRVQIVVHFPPVGQTVIIAIVIVRVGVVGENLLPVVQPVAVRIRVVGVRARIVLVNIDTRVRFHGVKQPVAVRVFIAPPLGIGAQIALDEVTGRASALREPGETVRRGDGEPGDPYRAVEEHLHLEVV